MAAASLQRVSFAETTNEKSKFNPFGSRTHAANTQRRVIALNPLNTRRATAARCLMGVDECPAQICKTVNRIKLATVDKISDRHLYSSLKQEAL